MFTYTLQKKSLVRMGFTIIEILMVFAIISILVSMVYSKLSIIRSKEDLQATNRTVTKAEISHGVVQYFNKNGTIPRGIPIGAGNKKPICTYGVTDNATCVNLDTLVAGNFLTTLKRDDSTLNPDEDLLGYDIYWDGVTNDISVQSVTDSITVADVSTFTLTRTVPAGNQTNVDPSATILTLTFNKNAWPQATGDNHIKIYKYDTDELVEDIVANNSAKVSGQGTTQIKVFLTDDFDTYTHYYGVIEANAFKDGSGNAFAGFSNKDIWDWHTGGICFIAGTPILLSDGTYKNIEDVTLSDTILGFDPNSQQLQKQAVTHIWPARVSNSIYEVVTDVTTAHVTGGHPFFTGNNTYTKVQDLQVGSTIYQLVNGTIQAEKIRAISILQQSSLVYNFATDGFENYIAAHTLVHNKSIPLSSSASSATTASSPSSSPVSSVATTASSSSSSPVSSVATTASSALSVCGLACLNGQAFCTSGGICALYDNAFACNAACATMCLVCAEMGGMLE